MSDDLAVMGKALSESGRHNPGGAPEARDRDGHGLSGDDLLNKVLATLTRYVAFANEHQAVAVVLWIVATHVLAAWQHATRLIINSPQKRCGKSRLLDVVAAVAFKPFLCVDATVAAIFRSIGNDDATVPTLMLDEADTLWGTKRAAEGHEDLRALFNAGFQRNRPAWRCVGPQQIPTEFPTFAMCTLAGIGDMPDTITDRGVTITLKRRSPGETVAPYRVRRDEPKLHKLRDQLTAWAREPDRIARLTAAEPQMPRGVEDRAADAWEPLLAMADEGGGQWPMMARAACKALSELAKDNEEDLGTVLLKDIRQIFTDSSENFLASQPLVNELRKVEESPWLELELTTSKLAMRLKPFAVKPAHNAAKTTRGYHRRAFRDAFERYLRPESSERPELAADQGEDDDTEKPPGRPQGVRGRVTDVPAISGEHCKSAAQSHVSDDRTGLDDPPGDNERRCRFCGGELRLPSAIARGHCSSTPCLAANAQQTREAV
jgi:hypothetical protein